MNHTNALSRPMQTVGSTLPHADGIGSRATVLPSDGVTLRWLIRLRWYAFVAQFTGVGIAALLNWTVASWFWLDGLILLGALTNVLLPVLERRGIISETKPLLAAVLIGDVLLLLAMLAISGGPTNPFTVVLLVHIALAAFTVDVAWTWIVVGLALSGYSALFALNTPAAATHVSSSHLGGMWVAFMVSAVAIAVFVTRVTAALTASQVRLRSLERQAEREARLAALTSTVGGAAHELATPLSSIAVAASELERAVARGVHTGLTERTTLIRSQVDRCRRILDQMSGRASEEWLDQSRVVRATEVVAQAAADLTPDAQARLDVIVAEDVCVCAPPAGLVRCLANVLQNAFDASSATARVSLSADVRQHAVALRVVDRGSGMTTEVLDRAGEPFFTTKPHGHGLGLFLVRQFAERHGGHLRLSSGPLGTIVELELPQSL